MKKSKLLIIGGGMSGTKFAAELVKKTSQFSMTILSQESYSAYNRILLSPVLSGEKKFSDITLHDDQWYTDHDISVLNASVAKHIDHANKLVITEQNETFDYDQLVIATGSTPFVIPMPGHDAKGVLTFRTKNDVDEMLAFVRPSNGGSKKKNCIIIGAGLLGLEAASALAKQGANVSVINKSSHILNRQLNDKAASLLQQYFEKQNIAFYLNANTLAINCNENNEVTGLELADGEILAADVIVMAVGVRPNKIVAESSGINCGKGIVVNDQMQTNINDVYALGECVEFDGNLFGLVAPTYEQANVLVNTLCRVTNNEANIENKNACENAFEIKPVATKLKVSGIDLFSAGDIDSLDECQFIEYEDYSNNIYKRLTIRDNKIIGVVLFGDVLDGTWYFDLINQQQNISSIRSKLLFGKAICVSSAMFLT